MITCPVCGEKSNVIESKGDGAEWIRIRKCIKCGYKFYTREQEIEDQEEGYLVFREFANQHASKYRKRKKKV